MAAAEALLRLGVHAIRGRVPKLSRGRSARRPPRSVGVTGTSRMPDHQPDRVEPLLDAERRGLLPGAAPVAQSRTEGRTAARTAGAIPITSRHPSGCPRIARAGNWGITAGRYRVMSAKGFGGSAEQNADGVPEAKRIEEIVNRQRQADSQCCRRAGFFIGRGGGGGVNGYDCSAGCRVARARRQVPKPTLITIIAMQNSRDSAVTLALSPRYQ
jgi:hypothetical protein